MPMATEVEHEPEPASEVPEGGVAVVEDDDRGGRRGWWQRFTE
jgi:hypothetical protein